MDRQFFIQPTPSAARDLIGKYLLSRTDEGVAGGRIVEAEAYLGSDDPAAHSFRGMSERNKAMFGEPGHAYVYFIYGVHTCINTVTAPRGTGHGVLIRALEPVVGIELMKQRRGREKVIDLCSGPGKLTQALGIVLADNGRDLLSDEKLLLTDRIEGHPASEVREIAVSGRIGISKAHDLPYRFYLGESEFVSG